MGEIKTADTVAVDRAEFTQNFHHNVRHISPGPIIHSLDDDGAPLAINAYFLANNFCKDAMVFILWLNSRIFAEI